MYGYKISIEYKPSILLGLEVILRMWVATSGEIFHQLYTQIWWVSTFSKGGYPGVAKGDTEYMGDLSWETLTLLFVESFSWVNVKL